MKFMNQDFVSFAMGVALMMKGKIGVCEISGLFRPPRERRLHLGAMLHEMSISMNPGTVWVRYEHDTDTANVEFYNIAQPELANDGKSFPLSDLAGATAYIGEEMKRYGRA